MCIVVCNFLEFQECEVHVSEILKFTCTTYWINSSMNKKWTAQAKIKKLNVLLKKKNQTDIWKCAAEVHAKLTGRFNVYSWKSGENCTCFVGQKFGFNLCFAKVKMLCSRRSSVLSQQVQKKSEFFSTINVGHFW